jgi:hypothetical protein
LLCSKSRTQAHAAGLAGRLRPFRVTVRARQGKGSVERGGAPRLVCWRPCRTMPSGRAASAHQACPSPPTRHPRLPALRSRARGSGEQARLQAKYQPLKGLTVSTRQAGRSLRHFACPPVTPARLGACDGGSGDDGQAPAGLCLSAQRRTGPWSGPGVCCGRVTTRLSDAPAHQKRSDFCQ